MFIQTLELLLFNPFKVEESPRCKSVICVSVSALFSSDCLPAPKNKQDLGAEGNDTQNTLNRFERSRLTWSFDRTPLCTCSSSVSPLIHSVSRGSCPHGKLYTILTPRDTTSSRSSSGTSPLLKSEGDSANWKHMR